MKTIAENYPNLGKEINFQAQETQTVPNKMNTMRFTPRYFIIKMAKIKERERMLKAAEKSN